MIEIIDKIYDPMWILSQHNCVISNGDIVSLNYDDKDVYCVLSNCKNPFGLVIGLPDKWGRYPILFSTAILKTNYYDILEHYDVGDFLYSDNDGLLTKRKCEENALLIGRVLDPPVDNESPMEINWI